MPPKPANAATAEVCALFGTDALMYKAYADRQTTTEEHWRLKIACSLKGIDKPRTKVSVCLVRMAAFRLIRSDFLHSGYPSKA